MASDQAFAFIPYKRASEEELNEIVQKKLSGKEVCLECEEKYKTELTIFLAKEYNKT